MPLSTLSLAMFILLPSFCSGYVVWSLVELSCPPKLPHPLSSCLVEGLSWRVSIELDSMLTPLSMLVLLSSSSLSSVIVMLVRGALEWSSPCVVQLDRYQPLSVTTSIVPSATDSGRQSLKGDFWRDIRKGRETERMLCHIDYCRYLRGTWAGLISRMYIQNCLSGLMKADNWWFPGTCRNAGTVFTIVVAVSSFQLFDWGFLRIYCIIFYCNSNAICTIVYPKSCGFGRFNVTKYIHVSLENCELVSFGLQKVLHKCGFNGFTCFSNGVNDSASNCTWLPAFECVAEVWITKKKRKKKRWRTCSPVQQVFFPGVLDSNAWLQPQQQSSRVHPGLIGLPPRFGTILKGTMARIYIKSVI